MADGTRVASAYVEIGMASGGIAPGIEAAKQQMVQGVGNAVGAVGAIGLGALGMFAGLAAGIASFVNSAMDAEQTGAKFNFMMDQMSPRLGFGVSQLNDMASSMAALTNQSAGAAKSVMSTLGMFDMVSGENFRLATQYSLQFANTGLASAEGAAHKLGIALTNPIAGLRLLRSMEIMFTMDQQNMIKQMVQMGDMAGAQRMILEGIGKTLPGLSAAMAGTTTAILAKMERDVKSIGKAIGEAILPVLGMMAQATSWAIGTMKEMWGNLPEPIREVAKVALLAAGVIVAWGNVSPVLGMMSRLWTPLRDAIYSVYIAGVQTIPTLFTMASSLIMMVAMLPISAAAWMWNAAGIVAWNTAAGVANARAFIFAGIMIGINTVVGIYNTILGIGTALSWAYSMATGAVQLAMMGYTAATSLSTLATMAFSIVSTIASGGLNLLLIPLVMIAVVAGGIFVAGFALASSAVAGFVGAIGVLTGIIGGIAAIAVVGYVIAFVAALVTSFRGADDAAKRMKESLQAVWGVVKEIGHAFLAAFSGTGNGLRDFWEELKTRAQTVFFAITNWIIENKALFISWGYYIGQIGRAALDIIIGAWNWFGRVVGGWLGWLVGENNITWGDVLNTITRVLRYIATLFQNLDLVWDIIVAGFNLAWAKITTGSQWAVWKVQAIMVFEDVKGFMVELFEFVWSKAKQGMVALRPYFMAFFYDMQASINDALAIASPVGGVVRDRFRRAADDARTNAAFEREIASGVGPAGAAFNAEVAAAGQENYVAWFDRQAVAVGRQIELEQQLAEARAANDNPRITAAQRELDRHLARAAQLAEENRRREEAARNGGNQGGQGGGGEQVSTMFVEFKSSGLVDMWKTTQQSLTGKLEGLAATHINVAREQLGVQQAANVVLAQINNNIGNPQPARAG